MIGAVETGSTGAGHGLGVPTGLSDRKRATDLPGFGAGLDAAETSDEVSRPRRRRRAWLGQPGTTRIGRVPVRDRHTARACARSERHTSRDRHKKPKPAIRTKVFTCPGTLHHETHVLSRRSRAANCRAARQRNHRPPRRRRRLAQLSQGVSGPGAGCDRPRGKGPGRRPARDRAGDLAAADSQPGEDYLHRLELCRPCPRDQGRGASVPGGLQQVPHRLAAARGDRPLAAGQHAGRLRSRIGAGDRPRRTLHSAEWGPQPHRRLHLRERCLGPRLAEEQAWRTMAFRQEFRHLRPAAPGWSRPTRSPNQESWRSRCG